MLQQLIEGLQRENLTAMLSHEVTALEQQAFALTQHRQWTAAASALDEAYREDPASFSANNLHYLRGRVAENQDDWRRAEAEFEKIGAGNPL